MPTAPFHFQELLELGTDDTDYRTLTKDYVAVENFQGSEVLVVEPKALTILASQAFSFEASRSDSG